LCAQSDLLINSICQLASEFPGLWKGRAPYRNTNIPCPLPLRSLRRLNPFDTPYAWFPASRIRAVKPLLLQKYVRITFIRKNSVSCSLRKKITFSVSVSSPLPFIRSYMIEFYFSVSAVRTRGYAPGAPPTVVSGKLGALAPGPAALLPRTGPSSDVRHKRPVRTRFLLRLRNDLYCVEWGVKLYSLTHTVFTETVP